MSTKMLTCTLLYTDFVQMIHIIDVFVICYYFNSSYLIPQYLSEVFETAPKNI